MRSSLRCGGVRQQGLQRPHPARPSVTAAALNQRYTQPTHYELLGLTEHAAEHEVKAAFRAKAKSLHPDVNRVRDADEKFMQLRAAYDTLSNARARQDYDLSLERRRMSARVGSSRAGAPRPKETRTVTTTSWEYCMKKGTWVTVTVESVEEVEPEPSGGGVDAELDVLYEELASWAAAPSNVKSSYQSSWQANRKKQHAGAASASGGGGGSRQATAGRGGGAAAGALSQAQKDVLLLELQPQYRRVATQLYGPGLCELGSLTELLELCDTMDSLEASGISFEVGLAAYRQARR